MKITDNERRVLRALLTNDFNNTDDPTESVWADCINEAREPSGIEGKALSGVVASLTKKGLVIGAFEGREAIIYLTSAGAEAAQ